MRDKISFIDEIKVKKQVQKELGAKLVSNPIQNSKHKFMKYHLDKKEIRLDDLT